MGENHLLVLKDLGKIYSDKEASAVGLRGIDLSFDIGEFVLLTGESGAGKTTLLNVIGGMDTFEEGKLFFGGKSMTELSERERDDYRDSNISFVYQEYNIVESFSVRDNVLMSAYSNDERQKTISRGNEMLRRVGIAHIADKKAGRLSGGQKQRVAIARALTENKSIILADEPTAHLDEENAQEIMALLAEASVNRLVIVSTHDPDAFSGIASRVIKLNNGEVEEDERLHNDKDSAPQISESTVSENDRNYKKGIGLKKMRCGLSLAGKMFASKPKTSMFIFTAFLLSAVFLFMFTGAFLMILQKNKPVGYELFRGGENRVIVTKKDGNPISLDEARLLKDKTGATKLIYCDMLYDSGNEEEWYSFLDKPSRVWSVSSDNDDAPPYQIVEKYDVGELDIGRYPDKASECMLYVPYAFKDYLGSDSINKKTERIHGLDYKIVGIKYYAQNDVQGKLLLTDEGYELASLFAYIGNKLYCDYEVIEGEKRVVEKNKQRLWYDFDVDPGIIFIRDAEYTSMYNSGNMVTNINIYRSSDDLKDNSRDEINCKAVYKDIMWNGEETGLYENGTVLINPICLLEQLRLYTENNYRQCSLFFDDKQLSDSAYSKLDTDILLFTSGSDSIYSTYNENVGNRFELAAGVFGAMILLMAILGMILHMVISRVMISLRHDVVVMRACGINKSTVDTAIYSRFLMAFLPAMIVAWCVIIIAYKNSFFNRYFLWLRITYCFFLLLFLILITINALVKNRKKYLEMSVKKALSGREDE